MQLKNGDIIFHNWIIKDVIGAGSFGTVYEIEREEFGRVYRAAAKVIVISKELVEETIRECDLMEQMKGDSHIVSYEDHYVEQGEDGTEWKIYIRMELLKPLLSYIAEQGGVLEEREVIRLGMDICQGLETCQKFNVLHKDIKLENIFVSDTGHYKLGDFGISKVMKNNQNIRYLEGTRLYMAPEILSGKKYDGKADIYSLGLVLYRLMNHNRAPFMPSYPQEISEKDKEETLKKRLQGVEIPTPCYAGEEFGKVIKKACAFQAECRFSTPEEMLKALENILDEKTETVFFNKTETEDLSETVCIQDGFKKKLLYQQPHKKNKSYVIIIGICILCGMFAVREYKMFADRSAGMLVENTFSVGGKISGVWMKKVKAENKRAAEEFSKLWIIVPEVTGLSETQGIESLMLAGYQENNITILYEYDDLTEKGIVLTQSVPGDSKVKCDSKIIITISRGKKAVKAVKNKKKTEDAIWKAID